jgi:hypothetical protein
MNEEKNESEPSSKANEEKETINNNDLLLIHFQDITHLDDLDECRAILESTNWNLDLAVQSYFNGDTHLDQEFNTNSHTLDFNPSLTVNSNILHPHPQQNSFTDFQTNFNRLNTESFPTIPQNLIDSFTNTIIPNSSSSIGPIVTTTTSTSTFDPLNSQMEGYFSSENSYIRPKRLLTFNIEYLSKRFKLHVPDDEKVKKLKELIEEQTEVLVKNQKLSGWKNKDMFINDETLLRDINLPQENSLSVTNLALYTDANSTTISSSSGAAAANPSTSSSMLNDTFWVTIKIINTNKQITIINHSKKPHDYSIDEANGSRQASEASFFPDVNFEGSIKFLELRRKVALLTNVITSNQEWWYYVNSEPDPKDLEQIKSSNSLSSFHKLIESEKLFSLPLTSIIEDSSTLAEMKQSLVDLTSPHNASVKKTTSTASLTNSANGLAANQASAINVI